MTEAQQQALFAKVNHALRRTRDDDRPVVLMTCGLAGMSRIDLSVLFFPLTGPSADSGGRWSIAKGSGKSTLAKTVVSRLPTFTRLSVDEIIHGQHGVYGVDYPADMALYQSYMEEAGLIFDDLFATYLRDDKRDLILDRSFYAKEDRDDFRERVESLGGRLVMVWFRPTDKEVSWQRIVARKSEDKTANNALDISRNLFDTYWGGFENPAGEGEIVIDVV